MMRSSSNSTKPFCLASTVASSTFRPTSCGTATDLGVGVAVGVSVAVAVGVLVGGTGVGDGVAVGMMGVGVGLDITVSVKKLKMLGNCGDMTMPPAMISATTTSRKKAISEGLHPPAPACILTEAGRIAIEVGVPRGLLTWRVAGMTVLAAACVP